MDDERARAIVLRGIPHGGWLPYLEKLGMAQQTASDWMREAGYMAEQSKSPAIGNAGDLPSRVAAGIDKRPPPPAAPRSPPLTVTLTLATASAVGHRADSPRRHRG